MSQRDLPCASRTWWDLVCTATPEARSTAPGPPTRLTTANGRRVWAQARQAADVAVHAIPGHAGDPAAAADTAWAASDYLTRAARLVAGNGKAGPFKGAARDLDHAAREQWGRVPGRAEQAAATRRAAEQLPAAHTQRQAQAAAQHRPQA